MVLSPRQFNALGSIVIGMSHGATCLPDCPYEVLELDFSGYPTIHPRENIIALCWVGLPCARVPQGVQKQNETI